jgi:hypothetical protein
VQSNTKSFNSAYSAVARGGYTVTVDSKNVATQAAGGSTSTSDGNSYTNVTASGKHLFFTSKIALAFTTGTASASLYSGTYSATGSGSMKYILGS